MKKLLLLFVLIYGCQGGEITLNEDDERFAALYADLLLLQADYERVIESNRTYAKYDSLQKFFSLHRISSEQFNTQLSRYQTDPARWLKVQERTLALLMNRREFSVSIPKR
ncbi:MAG: hypothetical protein ACK412_09635 [Chloroherpetonaceae bacterium]